MADTPDISERGWVTGTPPGRSAAKLPDPPTPRIIDKPTEPPRNVDRPPQENLPTRGSR